MSTLEKLQMWLFTKGSNKPYGVWDMLGNILQDIRTKLNA